MTLTGPDHIIHAVPYLLGFHPRDSIVLIWVCDGCIVLTQRYDRDAQVDVGLLQRAAARVQATEVIICGFAPGHARLTCREEVRSLSRHFDSVIDAIVVSGAHWWCAQDGSDACPAGGHLIDGSIADEVAVSFIAQGIQIQPDRLALEGEVAADMEGRAVVTDLMSTCDVIPVEHLWHILTSSLPYGPISPHSAARIVRTLCEEAIRDQLLLSMVTTDHASLTLAGDRLSAVLRIAPDAQVPGIGSVAAMARWLAGDGARAWACLDRAASIDPDHGLTRVVSTALHAGLPPSSWRDALASAPFDSPRTIG